MKDKYSRSSELITLICSIIPSGLFLLVAGFFATVFNKRIAVISSQVGNLGNRLFLFSNFIAFAIENNYEVINPAFYEYAGYFKTTCHDPLCRYPPSTSVFPKNNPALGKMLLIMVTTAAAMVKKNA